MNKVCLIGRVTKDIEMKQTSNNKNYVKFSLAVNRTFKDANGEYQADFINCTAWEHSANFLNNYVKKGNRISVIGNIQTGSYTNSDNQVVYTTDVFVEAVSSLENKEDNGSTNNNSKVNNTNPSLSGGQVVSGDVNPDDLPF